MDDDSIVFSDAQLQAILATLNSLKGGGVHWDIFLSAFLAMVAGIVVGVGLEYFKRWHESAKTAGERLEREAGQIYAAIVGITYNIEMLLHSVIQNIIPHHQQSHHAYAAFEEVKSDGQKIRQSFVKWIHIADDDKPGAVYYRNRFLKQTDIYCR